MALQNLRSQSQSNVEGKRDPYSLSFPAIPHFSRLPEGAPNWQNFMMATIFRVFVSLLCCAFALAPDRAHADTPGKLLRSPPPQMTPETSARLRRVTNGHEVDCQVEIAVKQGAVIWTKMSRSTGLAAADKEICDSILETWLFKPNLSGTFELPLAINAAKTVRYKSVTH
jgi:hypothetical protein